MVFHDISKTINVNVLIVGTGAAGIRTAIELQNNGISCLMLSRRKHGDAHTWMAAGGINASLGSLDPEDRWEIHAADTIREGHFINDAKAVETVCQNAPNAIKELQEWGCPFNLTSDGKINQRFFGAQSFRRTCFVGDKTGKAILDTLINKAKELQLPYQEEVCIIKIVKEKGKVAGAIGIDLKSGEFILFQSPVVVLACGGYSSVFNRSSSRADENLGDAIGLAYDAGAHLMDMEMVQFHPTGMVKPDKFLGKLVTEAVRGEGGRLFNALGERFMEKYSPDQMELDARDVVARAIKKEIMNGRGTKNKAVFLDISHQGAKYIKERLPQMYSRFKELGIDITKEPMEVSPTSHYSMGGIEVDFHSGETAIDGLFAVGESTAGLHGANRLGGNSLVETVVLGKLTGRYIAEQYRKRIFEPISFKLEDLVRDIRYSLLVYNNGFGKEKVKDMLWEYAGLVRDEERLQKGISDLEEITRSGSEKPFNGFANAEELMDCFDFQNISLVAQMILRAALERKESRGAHFRDDFPEKLPEWKKNILFRKGEKGPELFIKEAQDPSSEIQKVLEKEYQLKYYHLE